jgi:predicted RNA binding protein YcfA (HicA-like mRNA interferase family)
MPKLRRLSGADVIRIPRRHGFAIESRRGSHVKLRRVLEDGSRQTLTIPDHHELERGTLAAIYLQALRYVAESEIRTDFYSD